MKPFRWRPHRGRNFLVDFAVYGRTAGEQPKGWRASFRSATRSDGDLKRPVALYFSLDLPDQRL